LAYYLCITVTLFGPKGVPIPGWFEWDKYLNKVYVVKEWKDQDQNQTPVVRAFVVFPNFFDASFSLCLAWTETVLGQMRLLMPRTSLRTLRAPWTLSLAFLFRLYILICLSSHATTSQVVAFLDPFGLPSNFCWMPSCLPTSAFFEPF
jgi:hypothetical protein